MNGPRKPQIFPSLGFLLGLSGMFVSYYYMDDTFMFFNATCCGFWVLIDLLLAVWVYKDAESRGMNGVLWVIIFLIASLIGLLIYLIVREPVRPPQYELQPTQIIKEKEIIKEVVKIKCPYCGALVDQGVDRCPHCGAPLR